ncbi:MAG: SCO family protein [Siculibacillus sp.]
MTTRRTLLAGAGAAFALALAGPVRAAGPMVLGMRHDGRRLENGDITGWALVYFGYTFCPDVCPLGLQTIAEALDALGPLAEKLTPVFVTVDPERDTPKVLADYVAFFHPRLIGIQPTEAELRTMAKAWRVKYARVEVGEGRPYLMDHTASVMLADPDGNPAGRFPHDLGGARMAEKIRSAMEMRS